MTQDQEKEGVVIDVTPEREEPESPVPEPTDEGAVEPKKPTAAGLVSGTALIVAAVALIAAVAGGVFLYGSWQTARNELVALDKRLTQVLDTQSQLKENIDKAREVAEAQQGRVDKQNDNIAKLQSEFSGQKALLDAGQRELAERQRETDGRDAELRAVIAEVHERIGRSGNAWMVAEARFLMRLASHRLQLARDLVTAQAALELADQRLRDTRDPGWAGVRAQLAKDIASLAAMTPPDITGISTRLAALGEQVGSLKLARATQGDLTLNPEPGEQVSGSEERTFKTLLADLWQGLKNAVRIRRHDQPVKAMLAPEHQFFLYENLRLQLQAARLAALQRNQALYIQSLDSAAQWVEQMFDSGQAAASAMLGELKALREIELAPAIPDITRSIRVLDGRLMQLNESSQLPEAAAAPGASADVPVESGTAQ